VVMYFGGFIFRGVLGGYGVVPSIYGIICILFRSYLTSYENDV